MRRSELAEDKQSQRAWPWGPALVLFAVCLVWFGRGLDFSAYAHPDERNKINQIVRSYYNFNHPLLMLNSARIVAAVTDATADFEEVKIIGRSVSVFYASVAVGILALVMGRLYGRLVAWATGLFVMSNPHLFEFAHYFKEEPAVLFGISLTLLAIVVYSEWPGAMTAFFCGAAAGVAFSGKYAGIVVMPFAAYVVLSESQSKWRDAVLFISAFGALFLLINLPALLSLNHAVESLDREVVRLTGADQEVPKRIPHGIYTNRYWESSTPVLLGLLGVFCWGIHRRHYRLKPVEWAIFLMPASYFLILAFIPVTSNRYFLPCGVLAACCSAAGLAVILAFERGRTIAILLILLSIGWQVPRLIKANKGFAYDHLGELARYLETKIPPESLLIIGEDLAVPPIKSPRSTYHPIEPGETLESLREKGFTHIVVIPRNYKNFLNQTKNRTQLSDADFEKIKAFYESLFSRATLLRDWKEGPNNYLTKAMTLFSLQEKGGSTP